MIDGVLYREGVFWVHINPMMECVLSILRDEVVEGVLFTICYFSPVPYLVNSTPTECFSVGVESGWGATAYLSITLAILPTAVSELTHRCGRGNVLASDR